MFTSNIAIVYQKNLLQLKTEIESFKDESNLWKTIEGIANSSGNLCLHMTGNLNHFVGAGLGNTGYVRNRDAEFADKNIEREKLLQNIDTTMMMIKDVVSKLSEEDLQKDAPISITAPEKTTEYLLIHLLAHFNYHLGQINYLRRVIENS